LLLLGADHNPRPLKIGDFCSFRDDPDAGSQSGASVAGECVPHLEFLKRVTCRLTDSRFVWYNRRNDNCPSTFAAMGCPMALPMNGTCLLKNPE
jgi:hypothetical protein